MNSERRPMNDGDAHMDALLDRARRRVWEGPDHSPRVEERLRGMKMQSQPKFNLSRSVLVLIGVGTIAGGSLAAAVTHQIMSRRATLVTSDGTQYDVELVENGEGASGTFVTDDGTVFGIDLIEEGGQSQMTVDVTSETGGTSSVILEDGTAPTVLTNPGETATITIGSSDDEQAADESEDDASDE